RSPHQIHSLEPPAFQVAVERASEERDAVGLATRLVAPAEAGQVGSKDAMAPREAGQRKAPLDVTGAAEAVDEDDRPAGAAVGVVEPQLADVDEGRFELRLRQRAAPVSRRLRCPPGNPWSGQRALISVHSPSAMAPAEEPANAAPACQALRIASHTRLPRSVWATWPGSPPTR